MRNPFRNVIAACFLVQAVSLSVPVPSPAADPVCGDVNKSGTITTSDALSVLKKAVGQPLELDCPAFATPLTTGQTTCYDHVGNLMSCAGTFEDGHLKAGVARDYTDNGDGTITDNATGLMWETLTNDGSIHDKDNFYSWSAAFGKVNTLNADSFAGYDDWRLPNQFELYSLVHLSNLNPATYPIFNTYCPDGCTGLTCSCVATTDPAYWSSTTYLYQSAGAGAWAVLFNGGFTAAVDKAFSLYVRAVRHP